MAGWFRPRSKICISGMTIFTRAKSGGANFAAEMETNGRLNDGRPVEYAKGLRVRKFRGLRAVSHSGGSGGYRSY